MSETVEPRTSPETDSLQSVIGVRGARVHNLRNISVDIPRDRLVVITGVSGSGKSSLAFDTLFAEGQRRYLETLSPGSREFIRQLPQPDVDLVSGLPPTISVDQRSGSARIRSTLATMTGIYDYLRLLYARAGQAHCPDCGIPVSQQSVETIVERILALEERRKVMILAPLVAGRKGAHREVFEKISRAGFVRARVDGEVIDTADAPDLERSKSHTIEAIVDRIVVKPGIESRLAESVELALQHGEGSCLVSDLDDGEWRDRLYSSRYCCPQCGTSFPPLEPRTFSFNSPYGACSSCRGLGRVPDENGTRSRSDRRELFARPACPDCDGSRLAQIPRAVSYNGVAIHELAGMTVSECAAFINPCLTALADEGVQNTEPGLEPEAAQAAKAILPDVASRLEFLRQVGVHYLTLDRPAPTLSGGEFQRARLAGCLGSGLTGVAYLLDEPTIGLHARDTGRMIDVLMRLRDQGNSVLVVEHDEAIMRAADWLIDLGPGAGAQGGEITASGSPQSLDPSCSLTARFLSSEPEAISSARRPIDRESMLRLEGASLHNLKNVNLELPLGRLTAVTGVSGSGKTSLIAHTLVPALRLVMSSRAEIDWASSGLSLQRLTGHEQLDRLIVVDQSPIGRSGRSNPATQCGIWNEIRRVFAKTREARLRGFRARRFSFNSPEGRCPACQGRGTQRIEMGFLPDVFVECAECCGARFNRQTLDVTFRGRNVAEVLDLRVDEAASFFENIPRVKAILDVMLDVGLGYLKLGQSALTLSGGESQRVRLAAELGKGGYERTLFVLDEPTTGLHPHDVAQLLSLLQRLVEQGHSVLVVEHDLSVVDAADWVIDLGPEGGDEGGEIVAAGAPPEIRERGDVSHTAQALTQRRQPVRIANG